MKKLLTILAAALSFSLVPAYGIDNIQEILAISEKLQAETERAKAAKTPEEQAQIVDELERLTRRLMELAGMTQKDTEAAVAAMRESFKITEKSKDAKVFKAMDKKLEKSAKQLEEVEKSMDALGSEEQKEKK